MLRIALLSRRWSVRAGNEKVAVELARQMTARGHAITVYASRVDGSAGEVAPVVRLPGVSFDPKLAMLSYAWTTKRLVERLRAERATDVVIGFGHSVVHDVYRLGGGTHAAFLEAAKDHPEARGGPVLDRLALAYEKKRFSPEASPLLVAPSREVARELERYYAVTPDRIRIVWNGIDLERFSPVPEGHADVQAAHAERARVRAAWGVSIDRAVALFVGQDPGRKGLPAALEVARRLHLHLVYVGRAPRPRDLSAPVTWDGERSDVEACYRSADVLLAPSRYDPFGGVVLEALASGCLPVATRRIGATERMQGTPLDALLVDDPDDLEGLVRAASLALDPGRKEALRAEAHRVTRDAGRDAWGSAMEAVLEEGARQWRARA